MKKIKLKALSGLVADAKAAWAKAKKEKKAADEIKKLREHYEKLLMLYDGFTEEGKKEEDEVEIPDESKAAGAGSSGQNEQANTVEMEEIRKMISEAVGTSIEEKLPEQLKGQLTPDAIKVIVGDALKAHFAAGTKLDKETLKSVVDESTKKALEAVNLPSKMQHNQSDAANGNKAGQRQEQERGMIEVPYALTKGNLPLHMKQLLNVLLRKPQDEGIDAATLDRGQKLGDNFFAALRVQGEKALTSTGSGTGSDWVPRDLSAELHRRLYLESTIARIMLAREIDMPSDPFDLPISTTRPKFYRNNVQNREARASTPGTAKQTLATQKCMALVQYSYEANEDSIIPLLPLLQTLIGEAAADTLEAMLINGDSAATHMDSDITDPDDVTKGWDGFRKLLLITGLKVDLSTGGITRANLLAVKRLMGKWGRRPSDLMWITGGVGINNFLGLDEVALAQNRGATPTTATGTIDSFWGIPITVSEQMREDLNAAGVYDGVTTTKTSIMLVNFANFILGNRRSFTVEVDRNIKSQTNDIVASFRKAFKAVETPSATLKLGAIGYNFAP